MYQRRCITASYIGVHIILLLIRSIIRYYTQCRLRKFERCAACVPVSARGTCIKLELLIRKNTESGTITCNIFVYCSIGTASCNQSRIVICDESFRGSEVVYEIGRTIRIRKINVVLKISCKNVRVDAFFFSFDPILECIRPPRRGLRPGRIK